MQLNEGVMLNLYPDSLGGTLRDVAQFLVRPEVKGAVRTLYPLPTLFDTDLDHGFSVIQYELNALTATQQDLDDIQAAGVDLKMDFILNHLSTLSPQFQDVLRRGEESPYRDFFIRWNDFWAGNGTMTGDGYVQPDKEKLAKMILRRAALPFLFARYPDGQEVPYWNTFYQQVIYRPVDVYDVMEALHVQYHVAQQLKETANAAIAQDVCPRDIDYGALSAHAPAMTDLLERRRRVMGQVDLNLHAPLVWDFYREVLTKLRGYGAKMVRLDAFITAHKAPGRVNSFNVPETWELMDRVRTITESLGLDIIAEMHVPYATGAYEELNSHKCTAYDFFLPGLTIDAIDMQDGTYLKTWADEVHGKGLSTVNMLGCHDGIPLRDLQGLLPDERITALGDRMIGRGGLLKVTHTDGREVYYQMDITYFSALGEDEQKLRMARAIQLFMPGKPEVWYLDLFAGKNDYAAIEADPEKQNREINRTALSPADVEAGLARSVVRDQIEMMRIRNACPAFGEGAAMTFTLECPHRPIIRWEKGGASAQLEIDLAALSVRIVTTGWDGAGERVWLKAEA